MILIDEVIISDEILETYFMCNLDACKGACCWEGDWGAPLEKKEVKILADILDQVKPYLSEESLAILEEKGPIEYFKEPKFTGTSLHANGACVFLTKDKDGIFKCGIETAYDDGKIEFRKPISCHLYPIRVNKNEDIGFEALNYDKWDICNPACSFGEKHKMPLYKFAKDALIRAYGENFYQELEAANEHRLSKL